MRASTTEFWKIETLTFVWIKKGNLINKQKTKETSFLSENRASSKMNS